MKTRFISLVIIVSLISVLAAGIPVTAATESNQASAALSSLGDAGESNFTTMEDDPEPIGNIVSFEYNYIQAPPNPANKVVEPGTAIGALPVPKPRPGFIFNGWLAYDGATTVSPSNACLMPTFYSSETIINADTLLVANWSRVLRVVRDETKATVTAYLSNETIKADSVVVLGAAYDADGRLLKCDMSEVTAVPVKKPLRLTQQVPTDVFGLDSATFDSKSISFDIPVNTARVKAFLWDGASYSPICEALEPTNLSLVWSDEFDGTEVDSTKWGIPPDNNGGGNNEIQYYRPQNVEINKTDPEIAGSTDGSVMRIQAYRETGLPRGSWASCKLTTEGLFSVQYGRIEARLKTPVNDQGFWPAFWMMPATSTYGGWANAGEIDIYENKSRQSGTVSSALHYGGSWAANNVMNAVRNRYTTIRAGSADTVDSNIPVDTVIPGFNVGEWHTYAIEWYPDRIEYFVDDIRYQEINTWYTTVNNVRLQQPAPLDKPFYLILNLAVGGNFDNSRAPGNSSVGNMYIDYVRVYQQVVYAS